MIQTQPEKIKIKINDKPTTRNKSTTHTQSTLEREACPSPSQV